MPGLPYGTTPIGACPSHLPVVNNQKMVAYDVAAWADLWFYSNPIYIEVNGSTGGGQKEEGGRDLWETMHRETSVGDAARSSPEPVRFTRSPCSGDN